MSTHSVSSFEPPFLTIAIPTYNRADLLRSSLSRLAPLVSAFSEENQVGIEILVVDNCSTDNTQAAINCLQATFRFIRYIRNPSNLGIDGNIHECALNAKGKYVHLLSDDDVVVDTLYGNLIPYLRQASPSFVHLNVASGGSACSLAKDLNPLLFVDSKNKFAEYDLDAFAQTVHIWMTFLSSFVFLRSDWIAIPNHIDYIGSDIYLSHIAMRLISRAGKASVSAVPLIICRENFTGSYRIITAFAVEWLALVRTLPFLGYTSRTARLIEKITLREYMPGYVKLAKSSIHKPRGENLALFKSLVRYPSAWVKVFPIAILPSGIVRAMRKVKSRVRAN